MPDYVPSEEAKAAAREAKTRALTAYTMERIDQGPGEGNYDRILDLTISDILTAAVPLELERERERLAGQLQSWARIRRREAEKFVGPEKEQARWIAKGYDGAADLILAAALPTEEGEKYLRNLKPDRANSGGEE